jgi:hypothetical protein
MTPVRFLSTFGAADRIDGIRRVVWGGDPPL